MQTFLPYKDFEESARCLDNKRLGKQRVEAWQIYQVIRKIKEKEELKTKIMILGKDNSISEKLHQLKTIAWENHPAVKMWQGYEITLLRYGLAICDEWINRGFRDTMRIRFYNELGFHCHKEQSNPPLIGDEQFHASHRSNLLRKDPIFYGRYGWKETPDLPYIWTL